MRPLLAGIFLKAVGRRPPRRRATAGLRSTRCAFLLHVCGWLCVHVHMCSYVVTWFLIIYTSSSHLTSVFVDVPSERALLATYAQHVNSSGTRNPNAPNFRNFKIYTSAQFNTYYLCLPISYVWTTQCRLNRYVFILLIIILQHTTGSQIEHMIALPQARLNAGRDWPLVNFIQFSNFYQSSWR